MGRINSPIPIRKLSATSNEYDRGFHKGNPGGLDAVDTDLATGNIKDGVNIFGKVGTVIPGGTETIETSDQSDIAYLGTYTPSGEGIFFGGQDGAFALSSVEYYSTFKTTWYNVQGGTYWAAGFTAIGDGTNFRLKNNSGGAIETSLQRHHMSTGTYERAYDNNIAAGASYTPSAGFIAVGSEDTNPRIQTNLATNGWVLADEYQSATNNPITVAIADGTNIRVYTGVQKCAVVMRAVMT